MNDGRCTGKKTNGESCRRWPMAGSDKCPQHLFNPDARAKAAVRAEVLSWGLGSAEIDPAETLLRLLSQAVNRAERYAGLLEEQYRLAEEDERFTELPRGIRALVGHKYNLDREGNPVAVEEAIRALVELEGVERDRAAKFASLAISAGLAERQVRAAEQMGAKIAAALRDILSDPELGLTEEQRRAVPAVARRRLAIAG
jgi:hypothetical protein